ncbi:hypothetical protein FOZ60_006377 [Perkinsus olseni]|uniref:Uncharacterized protein n=1 Tax=Perkinsus olseni TaxID=32597 RepID=A0A7J6NP07_PEROL|nr:hypothetical protein FOZ60_006377 [Perkinsus olseni]
MKLRSSFRRCHLRGAVDWDKLDEVIEGTLSAEWTRVPSAEGFLMRLRKLDDKEARDHPDQKYCCEMAVDSSCAPGVAFTDDKTASPSVYDYGYDIYRKLPEVQRQQYDQAVSQFCEDGHWEEVDESEVRKEPGIPTVICFPVTSSTSSTVEGDVYEKTSSFKTRPVIDAVQLNKKFTNTGSYSASYGGRTTTDLLTGLRVNFCGPDRLSSTRNDGPSDSTLKLGTANRVLISMDIHRAFYRFRLATIGSDNDETNKSRSCDGMDLPFIFILCNRRFYKCRRLAFGLFVRPCHSRKWSGVAASSLWSICSSVNEAAKIIPILSAIGNRIGLMLPLEKTRVLSDSADEIARMHCICKSPEKRRFVSDFAIKDPLTRSQLAAFIGILQASNPLYVHPVRSCLCSLLARYASKVEPIGKWKVPLQFKAAEVKLMNRIVGCLQQDSEASSDCVHSSIGYGYVITTLKGIKLRAVAMPWNPRIHALVAADAVVRSDIYKRIKKGVKGMERLAVRRLVATVRDILLDWQDTLKIDVSLNHIAGVENVVADAVDGDDSESFEVLATTASDEPSSLLPSTGLGGRIPTAGYCSIKSSNRSLLNRFEVVQKDDCEYVLVKLKIGWRVYVPADIGEYELRDRLLQLAHDAALPWLRQRARQAYARACEWLDLY